jgi:DNA-directed RNA polymerase alpha subunit
VPGDVSGRVLLDRKPATQVQLEGLNLSIRNLDVNARMKNALLNDNILLVGELLLQRRTEAEILRIPHIGPRMLANLKNELDRHELQVGMVVEEWTPAGVL